jgi:hypothetical protein
MGELFDAIGRLQDAALLPAVGEDLDAISVLVVQLSTSLEDLRARGYVHQRHLEGRLAALAERWDQMYDDLGQALHARQSDLVGAANRLLDLVDRLGEPGADRRTFAACWEGVRTLQSRIEAAHRALHGQYDDLAGELGQLEPELARLRWTVEQVESAPITLLAGEAPLRAATVHWQRSPEVDGRPGLLILTDQRLLFVYREKVATKRFLFFTLEQELVQALEFEAPVQAVLEVNSEDHRSGLLGQASVDLLDVRFDETAPLPDARWLLAQDDSNTWAALVNRARTGDVDAGRTDEAAESARILAETRRQAPTHCPSCSAPLELPPLRGAAAASCRYCGTTIPL